MAITPSATITGAALTGLTSPTYNLTVDTAPAVNGKQWAILSGGGTQTGVNFHTATSPFTLSVFRPGTFKGLSTPNPLTGLIKNVPKNTWKFRTRKGVIPALNQTPQISDLRIEWEVPAGAETYDKINLVAQLSLVIGALTDVKQGFMDSINTGVM